ncbi:ferritin family protein [bacterium]|nr:ferritin family protein [candidate division CSSED10-310 bacterium]
MDFFVIAQKMETEGKAYYEKMAAETPIAELKGVFAFLAHEEQRHYNLFHALAQKSELPKKDNENSLAEKIKEIFGQLTTSFSVPEIIYDYQAAYNKALQMERESVKYYTEALESAEPDQKAVLEIIIKEENAHVKLIESLIDFVENPKVWLENSEWHHLDAY